MFVSSTFLTAESKLDLHDLSGYKCYGATRITTPFRLNLSGKIECLSTDGKICAGHLKNDIDCRRFVAKNKNKSKPIMCSKKDLKNKKHWCYKAKKFFFKRWHCPHETGLKYAVKLTKRFSVKCLSGDGHKCFKGSEADKKCSKANVCYKVYKRMKFSRANKHMNKTHKKKHKKFPYKKIECTEQDFMAGNWCAKAWAHFRYTGGFLCNSITGLDVAVRLSRKGRVECLSENGRDCVIKLKSDYDCLKKIVSLTDDNRMCPKTTLCHRDDFVKDTWCHTGFSHLYNELPKKALLNYRQIKKTIKNHVRRNYNFVNYRPPWLNLVLGYIKNPASRTKEGIRELKNLFKFYKINLPKKDKKFIISNIRNGSLKKGDTWRKVIKKILKIKGNGVSIQLKISKKQCYKKQMKKLKELIKRPNAKSDKGMKRILNFINAKFDVGPSVKRHVVELIENNDLKNKNIFKRVFQEIKDYVPMRRLRKETQKIRLEVKCDKKFFKKLKKMLKKGDAHTQSGLRNIKKYFYGHFNLKKKKWKIIKNLIKTYVVNTADDAHKLIKKIIGNIPKKNLQRSLWIKGIHY